MEKKLWKHVLDVRQKSPLVHSITNFVVMNNTANALLALGASPIMAHAHSEVKEMVQISNALVVNIGTIDEYFAESMKLAASTAQSLKKPWILDPVGAGATPFRDKVISELLNYNPTVIRGNASEIIALAKSNKTATKGVDSTAESTEAVDAGKTISKAYNTVVCISGETDIIISGEQQVLIKNGSPLMTKVTGLGCSATALIGAFIGVTENITEAVAAAMSVFGIAGQIAAEQCEGPGGLQLKILDKLYSITEEEFLSKIVIS